MSETVIKAENISKYYALGQFNNGSLYKDLQSFFARKMGKEDPNRKLEDRVSTQDGFWALKDVSFEIKKGDRVGIIGKNGAGKSTLLKILSEITPPTSGIVKLNGKIASLLEVGTGFHPEMTGRENIFLNGSILGMRKAEIQRKLDAIIDFSEIEEHIDTPVKRYSSGMYIRLAFSVAAFLESEILIADEVLAVGDLSFQKKALGKMDEVSKADGRTILFVSHNMSAVKGLCNKGILLDKGRITSEGNLAKVIDDYFENPFIGNNETIEEKIKKLPEDVSFKFRAVALEQDGKKSDNFIENGKALDVIIDYEVLRKEIGLRVYIDICDEEGELILRSFYDETRETTTAVEPGKYISKVKVPANFLGPKKYILRVCASIYNVRACCGDGIKIPLNVIQTGLYNIAYPTDTFRGQVAVPLSWENTKWE